jgi:amidohydrolase
MSETVKNPNLLNHAQSLKEQLIEWRRDFHQHPELGFDEVRTSKIVGNHLKRLGLEVTKGVGKTGVIGLLRGTGDGPTFALRADMDALPMQDEKQVSYSSQVAGVTHACGHDAHTTILMGAAQLLSTSFRPKRGNIKFIFQPAEEGLGGAEAMINDQALENPKVEAIAGLHVNTGIPTGKITMVKGVGCGAADMFSLTIKGKGGHAAHPHQGIDSISVAAEVISAIQHISSRHVNPTDPLVITIGKIQGGTKNNVIAPTVEMSGTVRTLNPDLRKEMPKRMEKVVNGVTEALGASYEFNYHMGYPSIINDSKLVDLLETTADEVIGKENSTHVRPGMGGEDFSFYTEHVPGVFYTLGVGNEAKQINRPGHHPMFDIDEEALPFGVAMLSKLAVNYLSKC